MWNKTYVNIVKNNNYQLVLLQVIDTKSIGKLFFVNKLKKQLVFLFQLHIFR